VEGKNLSEAPARGGPCGPKDPPGARDVDRKYLKYLHKYPFLIFKAFKYTKI
jgi:hypothetical protein